jgi:hypothetical protein
LCGNHFDQPAKRRALVAGNIKRSMKYFHQVHYRYGILRPIGNLLDGVFGPELFNPQSYNLCQPSSYLLCNVSLVRGVQPNERNNQAQSTGLLLRAKRLALRSSAKRQRQDRCTVVKSLKLSLRAERLDFCTALTLLSAAASLPPLTRPSSLAVTD